MSGETQSRTSLARFIGGAVSAAQFNDCEYLRSDADADAHG